MKILILVADILFALIMTDACAIAAPSGDQDARWKLALLEDILESKNDNDPRLDRNLSELSAETRRLFRDTYHKIPAEKRNERGTIVYLLGRDPASAEDWVFLREVVLEPPCQSLLDCLKKPGPAQGSEAFADEVTLNYPSLVALRQAERILDAAFGLVETAEKSGAPVVARKALSIKERFALRASRAGPQEKRRGSKP